LTEKGQATAEKIAREIIPGLREELA